jgi:hypothetical protein
MPNSTTRPSPVPQAARRRRRRSTHHPPTAAATATTASAGTHNAPTADTTPRPPSSPSTGPAQHAAHAATATAAMPVHPRPERGEGFMRDGSRSAPPAPARAGWWPGSHSPARRAPPAPGRPAGVDPGQMGAERLELGDPPLGLGNPGGHQWPKARPHCRAHALLPHPQQLADLLQPQAKVLGRGDEPQPLQRAIVIHPVAGRSPPRGQQPHLLVEPQRRGGKTAAFGKLRDPIRAHPATINLRLDSKVKPAAASTKHRIRTARFANST